MRKLVETANTNLDLTSKDYFLLAFSREMRRFEMVALSSRRGDRKRSSMSNNASSALHSIEPQ